MSGEHKHTKKKKVVLDITVTRPKSKKVKDFGQIEKEVMAKAVRLGIGKYEELQRSRLGIFVFIIVKGLRL